MHGMRCLGVAEGYAVVKPVRYNEGLAVWREHSSADPLVWDSPQEQPRQIVGRSDDLKTFSAAFVSFIRQAEFNDPTLTIQKGCYYGRGQLTPLNRLAVAGDKFSKAKHLIRSLPPHKYQPFTLLPGVSGLSVSGWSEDASYDG